MDKENFFEGPNNWDNSEPKTEQLRHQPLFIMGGKKNGEFCALLVCCIVLMCPLGASKFPSHSLLANLPFPNPFPSAP